MKVLKWLVLAFAALILVLALYLTLFFNPNDFKPEIIEQIKAHTGRTLTIKDDLNWSFFPTLGIHLGGISFSNPQGMSPAQMMTVDNVLAKVALMPLLSKQVDIEALEIKGLTVNLVTAKDGRTSFDRLAQSGDDKSAAQTASASSGTSDTQGLFGLSVGGVNIGNAKVNIINQQTNTTHEFSLDSFTLGQFSLGKAAELAFSASAKLLDLDLTAKGKGSLLLTQDFGALSLKGLTLDTKLNGKGIPNGSLSSAVNADVEVDLKRQQASLALAQLKVGNIEGNGKLTAAYDRPVPALDMTLALGDINLNDWLISDKQDASPGSKGSGQQAQVQEPELSGMKAADVTANVSIKSITLDKLKTSQWQLAIALKNGVLDVKNLSANLYDGQLKLSASLDGRNPVASYRFEQSLSGVQIRPLLRDAVEVDFLSGKANFSVSGSGRSLIPETLKRNLTGNGKFAINDGSLYGVNIPQMIRSAEAKLKGNFDATGNEELKTDFTSLIGNFSMKNGVVNNPDLDMHSPLIRVMGQGDVNIVEQTIDYNLTTKLVASLEGQGADDTLKGAEIPLTITGTFAEPEFALNTKSLLNNKVKNELKKQEDKLKNKLLRKLGGF
ncbi:MAG: AsmA family protein [Shewanella sp.]|nr:AsmA family protein [Shewanella sp.]MCF1429663.1 AsmA family protein [Shewanella sp.]MCF1437417.1 AsmA family protein [Shewanella sp.]MCF1456297.1 AsmA family protein [Shewanella sp.]